MGMGFADFLGLPIVGFEAQIMGLFVRIEDVWIKNNNGK
jgi:hypothetical protein